MRISSLLLLFLIGCSPVKQVLKDPVKFEQVAQEVIRRGKCVTDTVKIESIKDSIVVKDSIIESIKEIPCADFDTTIGRSRIRVSSGVLTFSTKDSIVYRTKTITNSIRDRSLENILKADIAKRDSIISVKSFAVRELQTQAKDLKAELGWWKFRLFLLIAVVIGWTVGKGWIRYQLSKL